MLPSSIKLSSACRMRARSSLLFRENAHCGAKWLITSSIRN